MFRCILAVAVAEDEILLGAVAQNYSQKKKKKSLSRASYALNLVILA